MANEQLYRIAVEKGSHGTRLVLKSTEGQEIDPDLLEQIHQAGIRAYNFEWEGKVISTDIVVTPKPVPAPNLSVVARLRKKLSIRC
jgi:hypothetical protein